MANNPLIYAVTVNWNKPDDSQLCLESLFKQDLPNLKVLFVDNGSNDGSVSMVRNQFPQAEVLALPQNLGFAGGYNRGIRAAIDNGADFVFILNNDATVQKDTLQILLAYFKEDVGILSPLVFYASPPDRIWSAGGRINRWNLEKDDYWTRRQEPDTWPEVIEQDFVTGCAMLFSRKALEQVGVFDENYRMYYEDIDLCYRLRRHGFRILLVPAARAWHKVATSSGGQNTPNERYWMARSSVIYFRKHMRGIQKLIIPVYRFLSAMLTTLRLLARGRLSSLTAYWRGLFHGLTTKG